MAEYQQFLATQANNTQTNFAVRQKGTTITLVKPRVGGIDDIGVWTGAGANGTGERPKTGSCYRAFKTDPIKSHNAIVPIQKDCQAGLQEENLKFCMNHEPNAQRIILVLRAVEKFLIRTGMEGIFIIIQKDGTKINMLRDPGRINKEMVDIWVDDVMIYGVWDPVTGKRLPVCIHDLTNMAWAGEALMQTTSEMLEESLQEHVKPAQQNGPNILRHLLFSNYRPSLSKVDELVDQLKAMSIKKFPAENVTAYNIEAMTLIREIKMNYMYPNQVPNLATHALRGLTECTDLNLQPKINELALDSDVNQFGSGVGNKKVDAVEALQKVEDVYKVLMNQKRYTPAINYTVKQAAFQAQAQHQLQVQHQPNLQQLGQQRGAGSTVGNHRKENDQNVCFDCGKPGHFRGNPVCPNPKKVVSHGLDDATAKAINNLINEKRKEYRDKGTRIPDGCEILMNGKVVAKNCRICFRFTKGASMHDGTTHGKSKGGPPVTVPPTVQPPATPPAPPALAQLANVPATVPVSDPPMCLPAAPPASMMMREAADYSLGGMSQQPVACMAATSVARNSITAPASKGEKIPMDQDSDLAVEFAIEESESEEDHYFYAVMNLN